jgi:undecaprenyl-diphosphatase
MASFGSEIGTQEDYWMAGESLAARTWLPRLWQAARHELLVGFAISLSTLLFFAYLAREVKRNEVLGFDTQVMGLARAATTQGGIQWMTWITFMGDWRVLLILGAAIGGLWWRRGERGRVVMLGLASVGGSVLGLALKLLFHRARPELTSRLIAVEGFSFPSGHALLALCFYGMLLYLLAVGRPVWLRLALLSAGVILIGMVGWSRIYLAVHYPSDVVAGFTVGMTWLTANILGYNDYRRRKARRRTMVDA